MPWVLMQNKSGKYMKPTLDSAAAAADVANLPDNMEVMITDSANPNAYPITGFTWLLMYENQKDPAKADTAVNFASWMITDGQKFALPLDYAPLKGAAQKKAEALMKRIKVNGAVVMR
jgi:phosphate transport system substrate-binding protein